MATDKHASEIALDYIQSELTRTGASKGDLARAMGISASALSKILKRQRQIELGELFLAQRFFDSPYEIEQRLVYDLFPEFKGRLRLPQKPDRRQLTDQEAFEAAESMRTSIKKLEKSPEVFDIFKTTPGKELDSFEVWDEIADARIRPVPIDISRRIGAIYMAGSAGSPRYEDGELVIFDVARAAAVGDYVIVGGHPDILGITPCKIGRLQFRTPDKIIIELVRTKKVVELVPSEVAHVRRIIPLVEIVQ